MEAHGRKTEQPQPIKRRFAGGVVQGTVTIGYTDDWQREGLIDAPAHVVWYYELIPDTGTAYPHTRFERWIRLDGNWQHVPFLDGMLDASFTGMMVEASRKADESAMRRYRNYTQLAADQYWNRVFH